jgi:hypothetical protein
MANSHPAVHPSGALGIFKLFLIILEKSIFNIYKISMISIALKDVVLERYVLSVS